MYDYGMVKSIHDQRMRQFMIEADRAHLLRQLRKNRRSEPSLRWLANAANAVRQVFSRRPHPAV